MLTLIENILLFGDKLNQLNYDCDSWMTCNIIRIGHVKYLKFSLGICTKWKLNFFDNVLFLYASKIADN